MATISIARSQAYTNVGGGPVGVSASISIPDTTVTGSTFTISEATVTVSNWVYNGTLNGQDAGQQNTYISVSLTLGGIKQSGRYFGISETNSGYLALPRSSSWTSKSWTFKETFPQRNTSYYFTSSNKTSRTLQLEVADNLDVSWYMDIPDYSGYASYSGKPSITGSANVTLDAPPTLTLGTPTYATPHYTGFGAYSVPLTQLKAQYGGDITKVTLAVGADSTEQTYSASTVSNQTISVTPTVAGTYTPTLTVEDSRGQITTRTFSQITVGQYDIPSATFDVYRTNDTGVKDDEGHYGLIVATIDFTSAVATLTTPNVKINGTTTNNVTWYDVAPPYSSGSTPISDWSSIDSGDEIYGLINGSFAEDTSYEITLTETDSLGGASQAITQTLSTAFYTIDFQAGGKEIAFGAPANDDLTNINGTDYSDIGLFKCKMGTNFNDMSAQEVSDFVTSLAFAGTMAVDFIVEQGTNYRKWNSGKAECWDSKTETINITTTANNSYYTTTSFTYPITFTATPNIFPSLSQDSGLFWASLGNTSTLSTTGCQIRIMSGASQSNKSITWHYYAIGTWK